MVKKIQDLCSKTLDLSGDFKGFLYLLLNLTAF